MTAILRYTAAGAVVVLLGVLGAWLWLSPSGRLGVLAAAAVAFPLQLVAFFLLSRFWRDRKKFLVVWMGGTVARFGVILLAAWALTRSEALPAGPTLLALAGFFFGLLLLEPFFLGRQETESTGTL